MKRIHFVIACGSVVLAAAAWMLMRSAPVDTPYFQWQRDQDGRYQLAVSHASGNPEFRQGLTTTPVPQSGTLRVTGTVEPGALVEVSNQRTGDGYVATADDAGAFAVEAQARRGDTLKVISRRVEVHQPRRQLYSSVAVSNP